LLEFTDVLDVWTRL